MTIKIERKLPYSKDKIFDSLSNSKTVSEWIGGDAIIENRPGGKFELFDEWVWGKIKEIIPNEFLSYTWDCGDFDNKQKETLVEFKLEGDESSCKVYLSHSGFRDKKQYELHKKGWEEHFFALIEDYLD